MARKSKSEGKIATHFTKQMEDYEAVVTTWRASQTPEQRHASVKLLKRMIKRFDESISSGSEIEKNTKRSVDVTRYGQKHYGDIWNAVTS